MNWSKLIDIDDRRAWQGSSWLNMNTLALASTRIVQIYHFESISDIPEHSRARPDQASPPYLMASTTRLAARLRLTLSRLYSSTSSAVPAAQSKQTPSLVVPQSPNRSATWSTNQRARPAGQSGPRFEQTSMELQPNPLSAMELIANEPTRLVHGRKAECDGGKSSPKKEGAGSL